MACLAAGACGGSTPRAKLEEVPIDQDPAQPGALPPDELNGAAHARNVAPDVDGSAAPGVGPQSLDERGPDDAGAAASPPVFVKRPHGLTEKQCNDIVLHFAKLMAKEHKTPAPAASAIPTHPIYGQMYVDCGQSTTKKQDRCAMAARTTARWKKCME